MIPASLPSDNYYIGTTPFVATADATCVVTTMLWIISNPVTVGLLGPFFRVAIQRNGAMASDLQYGSYILGGGGGQTAPQTRQALFAIKAGETIAFGAYLGSPPAQFSGGTVYYRTGYQCS